ncbi:hypothetical protein [Dictyobacter kobayashii]|uniref:Uncharacterized protein n=1 Tax=Dictyobacter kobayashii TaxID=2014872 RepID=A0A402ARP9_9CHLR|nr:hypothetical protein [Dictyobacter kobayashii]GCE21776.1 hypothetical protein KDK_55760 [Dictyobacter kobayashii]
MPMKKTANCENVTEISNVFVPDDSIAIVELSDEELANVVAGAGYAAEGVDDAHMGADGVLYRRAQRRYRRRAAIRRLLRRYMSDDPTVGGDQ